MKFALINSKNILQLSSHIWDGIFICKSQKFIFLIKKFVRMEYLARRWKYQIGKLFCIRDVTVPKYPDRERFETAS